MKKPTYKIVTLAEIRAQLNILEYVAFDVETDGLYGPIVLAQFYQKDWPHVLIVKRPEILELASMCKKLGLVAHNISYEVSTIQDNLGIVLSKKCQAWAPIAKWQDTLLLSKLKYYIQEKFSLDQCYTYALGADPYLALGLDKQLMQKADWTGHITEDMYLYAATDVFYLLDLLEDCKDYIDSSPYQLDVVATNEAFNFQTSGMPISESRIKARLAENEAKIKALDVPINVNSWKQVRPYIDESESDGLALATFALEGNKKAGLVREARTLIKQNSFLKKYLTTAVESRIYGKFTFIPRSGRSNSKDQNLQQLPRLTKGMFEVPEGKLLVTSDFAQLELRYIAGLTGERAMADMFKSGEDLHQYTADFMNSTRQVAKTLNFNLAYGGSANMLSSIFIKDVGLLLPLHKIKSLKSLWHRLWPDLTKWQEAQTEAWQNGKSQSTILGRQFKSKLYTDAMNLPVQGGSADVAKLAMHRMAKAIKADKFLTANIQMINFIHDNYMFEVTEDSSVYEPLCKIIASSMQSAWKEITQHHIISDIPMPVDVIVGKNWGDLEYGIEIPIYKLEQ